VVCRRVPAVARVVALGLVLGSGPSTGEPSQHGLSGGGALPDDGNLRNRDILRPPRASEQRFFERLDDGSFAVRDGWGRRLGTVERDGLGNYRFREQERRSANRPPR
jgi:hypothetical protein